MSITLSFALLVTFIFLPGLAFRRSYFQGEQSKQFSAGLNLVQLLTQSVLPGSIILLLAMFFYEGFFSVINLDEIIDKCKEFNDPQFKYSKTSGTEFTDFFVKNLAPFVFSVSVFAVVLGFLSQRAVHVWRLDQKFKLLRYKNLWFYLFRGTLTEGKSAEFLRRKNAIFVYTLADILVDTETGPKLYSGIIVDYNLMPQDCTKLASIVLDDASRYDSISKTRKKIPGDLFFLDCSRMININLDYLEDKSSIPIPLGYYSFNFAILVLSILALPFFLLKPDFFSADVFIYLYNSPFVAKLLIYMTLLYGLWTIPPYIKVHGKVRKISRSEYWGRLITLCALIVLTYVLCLVFST